MTVNVCELQRLLRTLLPQFMYGLNIAFRRQAGAMSRLPVVHVRELRSCEQYAPGQEAHSHARRRKRTSMRYT